MIIGGRALNAQNPIRQCQ